MIITVEIFRILIITKKMTGLLCLSCEKEDYTTVRFMLTKIYKAQNVSTVHHFGFRLQKKQKQKKNRTHVQCNFPVPLLFWPLLPTAPPLSTLCCVLFYSPIVKGCGFVSDLPSAVIDGSRLSVTMKLCHVPHSAPMTIIHNLPPASFWLVPPSSIFIIGQQEISHKPTFSLLKK